MNFWLFLLVSLLAGGVHVLAPDHWLPASVFSWQRGLSIGRTLGLALGLFAFHLLSGVGLYFILEAAVGHWSPRVLFSFGLGLTLAILLMRLLRFSRTAQVFRSASNGIWGVLIVLSLVGPAESLIPILIKARSSGFGYLVPILGYSLGTLTAGSACVVSGRYLWNRPLMLPRGMSLAYRRRALIPMLTGLAIAIVAVLRT